jgi:hypothetical protein
VKGENLNGYQTFAGDSPHFKINGYVSATVEGTPDDFAVNLLCTDTKKQNLPHSIFSEQMIFGGYFISRRLKSEEAWLKLERDGDTWKTLCYSQIILPKNSAH